MTLKGIGDLSGVEPSAVWTALTRRHDVDDFSGRDGAARLRRALAAITGWDIAPRHHNTGIMRHLQTYVRLYYGQTVSRAEEESLDRWVESLSEVQAVLDYDPDHGPNDACRTGGYFYRAREPQDDSFFRVHPTPAEE